MASKVQTRFMVRPDSRRDPTVRIAVIRTQTMINVRRDLCRLPETDLKNERITRSSRQFPMKSTA